MLKRLGDGNTSRVYLVRDAFHPSKQYALKIIRGEYLNNDAKKYAAIEQEIHILKCMKHQHVIDIYGYGADGTILKPSGV